MPMSATFATLDAIDAVKHKLTDLEYKTIVECLRSVHTVQLYTVQYNLYQCYIETVRHEDESISVLIPSESSHTAIVRVTARSDWMHPLHILKALRASTLPKDVLSEVQRQIAERGFFSAACKESHNIGGELFPWVGTKLDGTDVTTKITIVRCDAHTLP